MTIEEQIDAYRVRFRLGPVGRWTHALDDSPALNEYWLFRPDGTGVYESNDVVGYLRDQSEFVWHSVGDLKILCLVTNTSIENCGFFAPREPGGECIWVEPEPEETEKWQTIYYGFKLVHTEYGDKVVMCSIIDGLMEDGFWVEVGNGTWSADEPVVYSNPAD